MVSKAYSELYKQDKILPLEGTFQFKSPALFNWKADLRLKGNNDHWAILVNSSDNDHIHRFVIFN